MKNEEFKKMFYSTLKTIEKKEDMEKRKKVELLTQTKKQLNDVKKYLKKHYTKKIKCINVYDTKDNYILCNQFNNTKDFMEYVEKYFYNCKSLASVKSMISQKNLFLDRYDVVIDKYNIEDFKEDMEKYNIIYE